MRHRCLTTAFMLLVLEALLAATAGGTEDANEAAALREALGDPGSLPMQELWKGRGGMGIVTAHDETVVAFRSSGSNKAGRGTDGGRIWGRDIEIGPGATRGNAVVDETNGDILYVVPVWESGVGLGFQRSQPWGELGPRNDFRGAPWRPWTCASDRPINNLGTVAVFAQRKWDGPFPRAATCFSAHP